MRRPGSEIAGARDLLELDRGALFGQVQALLRIIRNTSSEIAMVAAENVFDKALSAKLKRKAGVLNREARKLEAIGSAIARAKYPPTKKSRGGARKRR